MKQNNPSNTAAELVLASASPRRQQMLGDLGLAFEIDPADIDETPLKKELPTDYVARVTREKAAAVASRHKGKNVLAADTAVCVGRRILGKPENAQEAAEMMRLLNGRRHKVLTAVALVTNDGQVLEALSSTVVKFRPLRESDIQKYILTEKHWQGVAGGYALQSSGGGAMVKAVNGSVSGVIGLPLFETTNLLKRCGYDV
tara:strand:- start:266249 stop:266851 length:603 start_codon:yes stop_codon:yes gene_type:complete